MTFLVRKDCVDVIFKIQRGVYLIVSVYLLSEVCLLLACGWGEFFNRLKGMRNRNEVLSKLKNACPLAANIFTNTTAPHFAYLDKEQTEGALVVEMKAPVLTNSIAEYLNEKVVVKAMELMKYNLNLQCEFEDKCPFPQWKKDLETLK